MKTIQRIYTIGSEWAYFKIYTGANMADDILVKELAQLVGLYLKNKVIDHWFFIRYADPDTHIRVRFHLTDPGNIGFSFPRSILNSIRWCKTELYIRYRWIRM